MALVFVVRPGEFGFGSIYLCGMKIQQGIQNRFVGDKLQGMHSAAVDAFSVGIERAVSYPAGWLGHGYWCSAGTERRVAEINGVHT